MGTVLERCDKLSSRLNRLKTLEDSHSRAQELESRRRELCERREALATPVKQARVLVEENVLEKRVLPKVNTQRSLVAKLQHRLIEDPQHLTKGQDYNRLLLGLEQNKELIITKVNEAWDSLYRRLDIVDETKLLQIEQIPGQAEGVENVRRSRAVLKSIGSRAPDSSEAYQRFIAAAEELARHWNSLDQVRLPEAVERFLRAARMPQGASVELWTEEVQVWMRSHKLLPGVRLHYRGGR